MVSIVIHAALLLAAALVVFQSRTTRTIVDFLPTGGTSQGAKASKELHEKVEVKRQKPLAKARVAAQKCGGYGDRVILPDTPADIIPTDSLDVLKGLGGSAFPGHRSGGIQTSAGRGSAQAHIALPPFMSARCSTAERLEKLRQNGGSSECEAAVSRSLEWLRTKQNADGSWGASYKSAMTGLSLLCYLGRCETPDSPFYGDNVMKGILYLVEMAGKNEKGYITEDLRGNAGAYEHGIATYALGEMYALSRLGGKSLPGMRETFENGVKRIIEAQSETGGWDYYVRKEGEGGVRAKSTRDDLSVTGWQYQALKAAKHTGLRISGLDAAISKTVKLLERSQTKDGGIGSGNRDLPYNQWNLTGTGVLGIQSLAPGAKAAVVDKGLKFLHRYLEEEPLDWNRNCNLYCWYYYTQVFFQKGGADWQFYNEQLLPQLLANQNVDGSWKPERANSAVAAVNEREGGIYKTTLCVLQLEVYYRYLRVADRGEKSVFDK